MKGRLTIVKELAIASIIANHSNIDGWSMSHLVKKDEKLIKKLINEEYNHYDDDDDESKERNEKNKFLYHKDKIGRQAIHYATMIGNLEVLKLLIGYGVDVNVVDNWDNWTCLHYACK